MLDGLFLQNRDFSVNVHPFMCWQLQSYSTFSKCEFSALIETVVDEAVKCNAFPPQSVVSR